RPAPGARRHRSAAETRRRVQDVDRPIAGLDGAGAVGRAARRARGSEPHAVRAHAAGTRGGCGVVAALADARRAHPARAAAPILMADFPPPLAIALAAVFGAAVGSFLNVCIYRLPRSKSIVTPASACPHCGRALAWYDNVPIVSWLVLG